MNQSQQLIQQEQLLRQQAGLPETTLDGQPLLVYKDPIPGTRYVDTRTGEVIIVPDRPAYQGGAYGGYYYDWFTGTWLPYGGPGWAPPFWWGIRSYYGRFGPLGIGPVPIPLPIFRQPHRYYHGPPRYVRDRRHYRHSRGGMMHHHHHSSHRGGGRHR